MSGQKHFVTKYNTDDVQVLQQRSLFQGFFRIVKYSFRHKLFSGGWSPVIERELFERGHAAALLPYDPISDQIVLIEQIRVGALHGSQPWQFEIVAGIIDEGETPEQVVRREALEEAGIVVHQIEKISHYYSSSGGCSETLDVFVGQVDSSTASGIHGLAAEGEDIQVHVVPRQQAYQMVRDGVIENGASIIALQWLELHRDELKQRWLNSNDAVAQ